MNASDFDAIPHELKIRPQWLLWRLETRAGKPTKVPYQHDGCKAAVDKPATWTDYETARTAYLEGRIPFTGVGFVLTAADPIVGVDLDKCLNPETGELDPVAAQIVTTLHTYCEISPSGRGLRLFALGKLPQGRRRKGAVEMYESGRYLTVTGHRFNGHDAIAECTAELAKVHASIFGKAASPVDAKPGPARPAEPSNLDDAALIEKARRARNGADFDRLWSGDTSAHNGDHSAADLALCNLLVFWTGGDPARVDRLFRQSGLMRPKWDERRGEQTYGERTITAAMEGTQQVFTPRKSHDRPVVFDPLQPLQPLQADFSHNNQYFESDDSVTESHFQTVTTVTALILPYFLMKKVDGTLISAQLELAKKLTITAPGFWYVPVVQVKSGNETQSRHGDPVWISIPFDLLATTDDGQGYGHGVAIRFAGVHDHVHTWTLPRALLVMEGREIFQMLYGMGFHMSLRDKSF